MLKSIELITKSVKEIARDEQKYLSEENAAVICSSYGERLKKADRFNNWLVVSFADVENPDIPDAIKTGHAEMIKQYVDGLDDTVKRLYICTDRAVSRSPAIKAALLSYRHQSDMSVWKDPQNNPNAFVYETLCREFGVKMPHFRAKRRKKINEKAFRKAMKNGNNT